MSDALGSPTLSGVALGATWFLAFLVGHVVLFQLVAVVGRFRAILRLLVAVVIGNLVSTVAVHGTGFTGLVLPALCGVLTIMSLWILYMPFYYVIATSMSVRTLIALGRAPGGALPLETLEGEFASLRMLSDRLETMVAYGNLRRSEQAFTLTRKGARTARIFSAVKHAWRLGPGG